MLDSTVQTSPVPNFVFGNEVVQDVFFGSFSRCLSCERCSTYTVKIIISLRGQINGLKDSLLELDST